jgi:hypothetical protein
MKLLAAAIAAAALGLPAAQGSSPATVPGLVYTPGYGNSILTRYDPVTLARSGPRLRLGGNASSWSWSPQRRYLAVGSYPQRLTVIDVADMRVVSRVRLARGGASVRAVRWARNRVLAVVETPRGARVTAVDPLAGKVVRRTQLSRPFTFELDRLSDGLVFLLGAHGRIEPVRLAAVDAEGRVRVAMVPGVRAGFVVQRERQVPGLAVDPVGRKAYVVGGERVVPVDLRTLAVSDRGPVRTLTKLISGSTRSAEWLGNGFLAFSGMDWDADSGAPAGLRLVDVRSWTARVLDRDAGSFTVAGSRLLVERATSRQALSVTAYGFDGRQRYRLELTGSTWMKKQGGRGYACRDAFLRGVVDLATGRTLRSEFPAGKRCPTLLVDDSHG